MMSFDPDVTSRRVFNGGDGDRSLLMGIYHSRTGVAARSVMVDCEGRDCSMGVSQVW
jgi:hypothetical protein